MTLPVQLNMVDNIRMKAVLLILFLLPSIVVAGGDAPPPLPDQFGEAGQLSDFAGAPVMAIVTSRRQLRWIEKWEAAIRAEVPGLVSIRVADIADEPPPAYEKVARMLRKRAPPDVSVLIDLDREWAQHYALDTGEPCLLIFDSEQQVAAAFRGRPKGDVLAAVMTAVRTWFPAEGPK